MKFKKYYGYAMAAIAAVGFASCTNQLNEADLNLPNQNLGSSFNVVKSPDVIAWSGSQNLGNARSAINQRMATRASELHYTKYLKCQDFQNNYYWSDWAIQNYPEMYAAKDFMPATTDRGESVSTNEYNYVMNYLREHPNEGGTECNLTTYFIQNVGSSKDSYLLEFNPNNKQNVVGGDQMDYLVIGGYHMNDYNAKSGPRALVVDVPVQPEISYHDSYGTEDKTKTSAYRFYYITLPDDASLYGDLAGKTQVYLCFDYQVKKYDNGLVDFKGDGIFNDWVIKLVPSDGKDVEVPSSGDTGIITPEEPEDNDGDENNGDNNIPTVAATSEVEVNLAINDDWNQGFEGLVTKLSIHVRQAGDVEVFIPVGAKYYCDADDMYIFDSHEGNISYGGPETISFEIAGQTVTLSVSFEENGIRVTTSGINEEVFNYCVETNHDGINFEVYNYFNTSITREQLRGFLNESTIEFLGGVYPDFYINAFTDHGDGHGWIEDATVSIVDHQENEYLDPITGNHLNASPYNEIYTWKEYEGTPGEHEHGFIWE